MASKAIPSCFILSGWTGSPDNRIETIDVSAIIQCRHCGHDRRPDGCRCGWCYGYESHWLQVLDTKCWWRNCRKPYGRRHRSEQFKPCECGRLPKVVDVRFDPRTAGAYLDDPDSLKVRPTKAGGKIIDLERARFELRTREITHEGRKR